MHIKQRYPPSQGSSHSTESVLHSGQMLTCCFLPESSRKPRTPVGPESEHPSRLSLQWCLENDYENQGGRTLLVQYVMSFLNNVVGSATGRERECSLEHFAFLYIPGRGLVRLEKPRGNRDGEADTTLKMNRYMFWYSQLVTEVWILLRPRQCNFVGKCSTAI